MSFLQMSVSGAVFILAVMLIRAAAMDRLPKRTFLLLWELAMARLLVPFSIPSVLSVYTLAARGVSSAAPPEAGTNYGIPAVRGLAAAAQGMKQPPAEASPPVSPWFMIWCAGAVLLALFFTAAYLRCLREFRTALPVRGGYVEKWLEARPSKRPVSVRQFDRISTPLTYGVFRPVILMPKKWTGKMRSGWDMFSPMSLRILTILIRSKS